MGGKTRFAIVGAGHRALHMYASRIVNHFKNHTSLVGLCDINQGRMDYMNRTLGTRVPTFTDFDRMMEQVMPDSVIVCTKDTLHHEFIVNALDRHVPVITEKPMTIDPEKCRAILEAERRSKAELTVAFNYRNAPHRIEVKKMLESGRMGRIVSVDFRWYLDTVHGANYFRRWHRNKEDSGGLFVHKATHHFDLVNWWLGGDIPKTVFAVGARNMYGPTRGDRGERCLTCDHKRTCEFYLDIATDEELKGLYLDVEKEDGYIRDRCVFGEDIDIEDTMGALVIYRSGIHLNYSMHAFCPWEGYEIGFNGIRGRLTLKVVERAPWLADSTYTMTIMPLREDREVVEIPKPEALGHDGADIPLLEKLFLPGTPDPYKCRAGAKDGAYSILVGCAANKSISENRPVHLRELVPNL